MYILSTSDSQMLVYIFKTGKLIIRDKNDIKYLNNFVRDSIEKQLNGHR